MSTVSNIKECSVQIDELEVLKIVEPKSTDVERLNESIETLNKAIKNAPRDQTLALLKTALTVTLATLGILFLVGALAVPNPVGIGFLVAAATLDMLVSPIMWDFHEEEYGFHYGLRLEMPVPPPFGSIVHLYSVFSMPSRLTKKVRDLSKEML